jgi:hypothetical protein
MAAAAKTHEMDINPMLQTKKIMIIISWVFLFINKAYFYPSCNTGPNISQIHNL